MNKYIIAIVALLMFASSCSRQEDLLPESVLEQGGTSVPKNEIDTWIDEHLTKPYGIEVVYRWDHSSTNTAQHIYPPKAEKILPVLHIFKQIALGVYARPQVGDLAFFKRLRPYRIYLYGGSNLDINGVELISNPASPSLEMSLYNVNDFDAEDANKVYLLARSIHRQFAYRIMSLYPYDKARFALISQGKYEPSSIAIAGLYDAGEASNFFKPHYFSLSEGFLSLPSMLSPEDDLAEFFSLSLLHPVKEINDFIESAKVPEEAELTEDGEVDEVKQELYNQKAAQAYKALREKRAFLKEYFDKRLNLSIELLQIISLKTIKELKPYEKPKE